MKPEKLEPPKSSSTKYLIDANIFLEVQLDQENAKVCENVLRKLQQGEIEGILIDFTIDTIVVIMENYGKSWNDIKIFLSSLFGYEGIYVQFTTLSDRIAATNYMKNFGLDFDDALVLQAMKKNGIASIISYDKDFDKVSGIKRVLPENLLWIS